MTHSTQSLAPEQVQSGNENSIRQFSRIWIDGIKGIAILGIFLNHIVEPLIDAPMIGFPSANWGSLSDRLAQLQPISFGIWTIPLNLLRYFGWMGNYGVALFIIASGFGLVTSQLCQIQRGTPVSNSQFWLNRCERIYPMWLLIHVICIVSWLITGWGLSSTNWRTWVSLTGWRILPSTPFYFASAWWFIGLILQLYLIYPWLWQGLERWGTKRFLLACCGLGLGVRAIGFFCLPKWASLWSMGVFGLARLPEFALGMVLGYVFYRFPVKIDRWIRQIVLINLVILTVGTAAGLTWTGAIFFHLLTGSSLSFLLYVGLSKLTTMNGQILVKIFQWFGRHSYGFFLVHAPLLALLLPKTNWQEQPIFNLIQLGGIFILSVIAGELLDKASLYCVKQVRGLRPAKLIH
jgi:peptidoglycan/LPS O-acetylase OafA/YrhL